MLKKIIFLIIIISFIGWGAYKYIPLLIMQNSEVISIDVVDTQYKFKPNSKEGDSFNGESLTIYNITREKLLPTDKNDIKNNITESLPINEDEDEKIEQLGEVLEIKNKIYLQLGSYKSIEKARQFLKEFKEINSNLTNNFKFIIVSASIEERGTYHRIRLGPFNDNKEIYALCIDLKLVNNECLIVKGN